MPDVIVVNVRNGFGGVEYLARGGKGVRGSVLANPRRIGDSDGAGGRWERGATVDLFGRDLRAALDRDVAEAFWWDGRHHEMRKLSDRERAAMRAEMNRLYRLAKAGTLLIGCWCRDERHTGAANSDRCHLDEVKAVLLSKFT
jgi:hypothetical protein